MTDNPFRVPGVYPGTEQTPKQVLFSTVGLIKVGTTLAASKADVLPGDVLGRVTASGKYRRRPYTQLAVAAAIGNTEITVDDASSFVVGDAILIEAEAATVTAVDVANNKLTLAAALASAHAIDSVVKATDGSEVARCIAMDRRDAEAYDQLVDVAIGGVFLSSALRGLDNQAITELGGKLLADFGVYKF